MSEREEKHDSTLIHKVPRNICVVLLRHPLCEGVCLWVIFLPNSPFPGAEEEVSLSLKLRRRDYDEEIFCCHK